LLKALFLANQSTPNCDEVKGEVDTAQAIAPYLKADIAKERPLVDRTH